MLVSVVVKLVLLTQVCLTEPAAITYGPPKVEGKPNLLDSFIPASMQIMAHLTELMKYDLRPTTSPPFGTTTSTIRPTPTHRPAIYAPSKPPGPAAYFAQKGFDYREYIERLQRPSGYNYFDRYKFRLEEQPFDKIPRNGEARSYAISTAQEKSENDQTPSVDYDFYFGKGYANTLRLANRIDSDFVPKDPDIHVQEVLREFDDSNFRLELLRQKKVPPTKAYVTLLSLYDLLNKESKRLGLNKYQGYSDRVLQDLVESSSSTSSYQLRTVLSKIIEREDTKKPDIVKKMKQLITDLDEDGSYINVALRYIPPLAFVF